MKTSHHIVYKSYQRAAKLKFQNYKHFPSVIIAMVGNKMKKMVSTGYNSGVRPNRFKKVIRPSKVPHILTELGGSRFSGVAYTDVNLKYNCFLMNPQSLMYALSSMEWTNAHKKFLI